MSFLLGTCYGCFFFFLRLERDGNFSFLTLTIMVAFFLPETQLVGIVIFFLLILELNSYTI